jgi:hypothetical protein
MSQPIPTNNNLTDFPVVTNGIWPDQAIYLEPLMIGNIISAFVYGGLLFLSLSYLPLILKASNNTISRRMRNFLLVYVTFMVTNSTVYLATMSIALTSAILSNDNGVVGDQTAGVVCTILASWGADGFMVSKFQKEKGR